MRGRAGGGSAIRLPPSEPVGGLDREATGDRRERGSTERLLLICVADEARASDPRLALGRAVALEREREGDLRARHPRRDQGRRPWASKASQSVCGVFAGSAWAGVTVSTGSRAAARALHAASRQLRARSRLGCLAMAHRICNAVRDSPADFSICGTVPAWLMSIAARGG